MEFTKSQQLAIDLRDRNILVSAAAGSGKTATLTERILRLLTNKDDPADVDSMLIVTFTRAAAGELRTRISRKLSDALADDPSNSHIARQITSLPSAKICTIDSYYLDLIKNNFQILGIPARFRLADEAELQLMRYEVMNAVIERRYEIDPEFSPFADEITTAKGEHLLAELLLDLSRKVLYSPKGTQILSESAESYKRYADCDFFDTAVGSEMLNDIQERVAYLLKRAGRVIQIIENDPDAARYGPAVSSDIDFLNSFAEVLCGKSYAEARQVIFDYSPIALGRISSKSKSEATEEVKNERNEIKEAIIKLRDKEFFAHPDDLPHVCRRSSELCLKLKEILDDYLSAYQSEKASRNVCEFSDLRQYALDLLIDSSGNPTKAAEEERAKYKHIFVDEYQDTDNIQDLVFKTISNGKNLFFVGDIKQSIYSFRGANPSVFSAYRKAYLPASGRESIPDIPLSVFMSENFRCSPEIIHFTNAVCSYLFRETEGKNSGIGYLSEDDLIASRGEPTGNDKVRIVLIDKNGEDSLENPEHQFVISEIRKMLDEKTKPDGSPYLPGDIAILTRSNKEAASIANSLAKAGISHANSTGDDLFENSEVLLMLSMLSVSDNPRRDIPLAAVLRSPIFGFSMDDIIKVRTGRYTMPLFDAVEEYSTFDGAEPDLMLKCSSAVERILFYRSEAEAMPVHAFMRFLWKDTGALAYAGSEKSTQKRTPIERRRNLRKFYEYARRYEASSYKGLHDFVEYINGIITQNTKITEEDAANENTVRIMTVHKSKGLEFPAVFLIGCAKSTNSRDSSNNVLFLPRNDVSLAYKVSDSTGFGLLDTPFRVALSDRTADLSAEEEIRILYVALTRARDHLCIVASPKEPEQETLLKNAALRSSVGGKYSVLDSSSWLDMILLGLTAEPSRSSYTIENFSLPEGALQSMLKEPQYCPDQQKIHAYCNAIRPSLEFRYPFAESSQIPAKVSVSRLYPELLNDADDSLDISQKIESITPRTPRFMGGGDSSADRGTATHLFMQFCDFSRLEPNVSSVNEEIGRLIAEKYIPSVTSELIRSKEIAAFVASPFFKRVLSARKVYRELRFNVFLPAENFTDISDKREALRNKKILVQGVIDLCFIDTDGKLILCDYKTDRLNKDALKDCRLAKIIFTERHAQQLKYYAQAIEQIMGKRPDAVYIYSLAFGDAIQIDV